MRASRASRTSWPTFSRFSSEDLSFMPAICLLSYALSSPRESLGSGGKAEISFALSIKSRPFEVFRGGTHSW
jgi:hypothetical protein